LKIDEGARSGAPVCAAASILPDLPQNSKLLIIRLRSLGDLILETPLVAALHDWRPDLKIHLLVEPRFRAVFEGNPAVSNLIDSGRLLKTAAELRNHAFPIVFNQHGGPRSALLTAASRSPKRVCWKGFQFSLVYNVLVPDAKEFYGTTIVHPVEHRISQLYWTGLPRGPIPVARVFPQPAASESVRRVLLQHGLPPGAPYAVLQPGARLPGMRWPAEKFRQVAEWLRERHGIPALVNVSAADATAAGKVKEEMGGAGIIPDPLSLPELIALVAEARLFVGNDSGPAHIAAATGRPAVVIYGQTNPAQWHPWQTSYRAVHTGAIFNPRRGDKSLAERESRPIRTISVEEVCRACEELLDENP
jgi:heptosyltransferase-3